MVITWVVEVVGAGMVMVVEVISPLDSVPVMVMTSPVRVTVPPEEVVTVVDVVSMEGTVVGTVIVGTVTVLLTVVVPPFEVNSVTGMVSMVVVLGAGIKVVTSVVPPLLVVSV
jgi:hypothetical protein